MKSFFLFLFGLVGLAQGQDSTNWTTTPVSPPPVQAVSNDVNDVLNRVLTTYKTMGSYNANGAIVSDKMDAGTHVVTTTTFTLRLQKPNRYFLTWNQSSVPQALPQGGAVWSDGSQAYLYLVMDNSYSKIGDDVSALGAANAVSDGAANTIPSLFLPAFTDKGSALARLRNPVIEKTDFANGEECYVISGQSNLSKKESYWISKSSNLILKYEKSLEPPETGVAIPNVSDDILEKALKSMGQPVTEESKKQMREMLKTAQGTLKNSDVTGTSSERQAVTVNPVFYDDDFRFKPPQGTTLSASPLEPKSVSAKPVSPGSDMPTNAPAVPQ